MSDEFSRGNYERAGAMAEGRSGTLHLPTSHRPNYPIGMLTGLCEYSENVR